MEQQHLVREALDEAGLDAAYKIMAKAPLLWPGLTIVAGPVSGRCLDVEVARLVDMVQEINRMVAPVPESKRRRTNRWRVWRKR